MRKRVAESAASGGFRGGEYTLKEVILKELVCKKGICMF